MAKQAIDDADFEVDLPPEAPRTPVAETKVRSFVGSKKKANSVNRSSARLRREDVGDTERLSGLVPAELAERVRERVHLKRSNLSAALTEAFELWMKRT